MEGYKKATGELLLFTDADTKHSQKVISLAVSHLLSFNLDALSAIPKMRVMDFWTRITLPMISTFLHTRFSAIRVNDPSKKTAYFFGSFFIIRQKTYKAVGMHVGVKNEIIEDGALGKKVKEMGHHMKIVRGDHLIEAIWARDKSTLWNALKRLMIPLYLQSEKIAVGCFFAVLFLLFMPFPILAYSALSTLKTTSLSVLFVLSLATSIMIYIGAIIEVKKLLQMRLIDALFAPIGSLVVVLGFLSGLLDAKNSTVSWRGRKYSMKDHVQNSISV
jgi:cellulose synthase/poly-beta-1,6-N-acetylglucosamine synthase-like glycosyltransferase